MTRTWMLRRFAEVQAALHEPGLAVPGTEMMDSQVHREVQRAVGMDVTTAMVASQRPVLVSEAQRLLDALPDSGAVVDFGADVSEPWSRAVTAALMALDAQRIANDLALARLVFEAAAQSTDGETTAAARAATIDLAMSFGTGLSPAAVQTFVALTQSLPLLVSAVVLALLEHPAQLNTLRSDWHGPAGRSAARTAAVQELLRFATPSRAVYRRAIADVRIGAHDIVAGNLVVLHLADANRDVDVFPEPDRLDLARGSAGHVTFGAGPHRCAGAAVVRLLVECFLDALLTSPIGLVRAVDVPVIWLDGPALRAPRVVPVRIERAAGTG